LAVGDVLKNAAWNLAQKLRPRAFAVLNGNERTHTLFSLCALYITSRGLAPENVTPYRARAPLTLATALPKLHVLMYEFCEIMQLFIADFAWGESTEKFLRSLERKYTIFSFLFAKYSRTLSTLFGENMDNSQFFKCGWFLFAVVCDKLNATEDFYHCCLILICTTHFMILNAAPELCGRVLQHASFQKQVAALENQGESKYINTLLALCVPSLFGSVTVTASVQARVHPVVESLFTGEAANKLSAPASAHSSLASYINPKACPFFPGAFQGHHLTANMNNLSALLHGVEDDFDARMFVSQSAIMNTPLKEKRVHGKLSPRTANVRRNLFDVGSPLPAARMVPAAERASNARGDSSSSSLGMMLQVPGVGNVNPVVSSSSKRNSASYDMWSDLVQLTAQVEVAWQINTKEFKVQLTDSLNHFMETTEDHPLASMLQRLSRMAQQVAFDDDNNPSAGTVRREMAASLYFFLLEKVLEKEESRVLQRIRARDDDSNEQGSVQAEKNYDSWLKVANGLMHNDSFHSELFVCCLEIVIAAHHLDDLAFPVLLGVFQMEACYFGKILEIIMKFYNLLPNMIYVHFAAIEERILQSLAWESTSPIHALLADKTNMEFLSTEFKRPSLAGPPPEGQQGVVNMPPQGSFLKYFVAKVLSLLWRRLDCLAVSLSLQPLWKQHIWTGLCHAVIFESSLLKGRFLDQLLMATVYAVGKVLEDKNTFTFMSIIKAYRAAFQPVNHQVYRDVLLTNASERGDIIAYYNTVYVPAMKIPVLKLQEAAQRGDASSILSEFPGASPVRLYGPRFAVSPMRNPALAPNAQSSGRPGRLYNFGQSPSRSLETINNAVNRRANLGVD
jgi:hypothetical protein